MDAGALATAHGAEEAGSGRLERSFRARGAGGPAQAALARGLPPRARAALREAVPAEIPEERVASDACARGLKRKTSGYKLRPRAPRPTVRIDFNAAIRIVK